MPTGQLESRLAVFMFTDIVGSTAMKGRLGTANYAALIGQHNGAFRSIIAEVPGAIELENPGDGFLARFPTASTAVQTALRFQYALRAGPWDGERLDVRIGLHMGEVLELEVGGHEPEKFVGTPLDLAARVESLALPRQVLMTRGIFDDARMYVRESPHVAQDDDDDAYPLKWVAHGAYLFKGAEEPTDVYEVGLEGLSPLEEPPDSEKARRAVVVGDEVLGWRPASGLAVPARTRWVLDRKIGEGAFGEVWVARHARMKTERVFKFCHDADRVHSFKREMTLFRLLQTTLGDRPDIAKIYDVRLDESPYYLESEYLPAGDLGGWAEGRGGIATLPLETRIDIVARTAEAVAAAHSVGILHKDIKPGNILIKEDEHGAPQPRLADFGISAIADPSRLEHANITMTGFTEEIETGSSSGAGVSGTRVYMPPEVLAGDQFTTQGDVYALGVLLYQMVAGDLKQVLAPGWEADIDDLLLREDIAECADGHRESRLAGPIALANRLRELPARRRARRRRKLVRVALAASVVIAVLGAIVGVMLVRESGLRRAAERQAAIARAVNEFINDDMLAAVAPSAERGRGKDVLMRDALDVAAERIDAACAAGGKFADKPLVEAAIRTTLGVTYEQLGEYAAAEPHLARARVIHQDAHGAEDRETLDAARRVASNHRLQARYDEAEPLLQTTLEIQERTLGADHADTLLSVVGLARLRQDQGRYDDAEPLFVRAVEARSRVVGEEHKDTLASMDALAGLHLLQTRYDDAEPLYVRSLEFRERELGPAHPETLRTMNNLAALYFRQSRYDEAESTYREMVDVSKQILGEEHPDTLGSMGNLATLYRAQGRYDEVEPLYLHVFTIAERDLGEEHPDTLRAMTNLADLYRSVGRYDDAETFGRRSLDVRTRVLGAEHPDTLLAMNGLAYLYCAQERFADAEPLAAQAAEVQKRTVGAEHEETLNAEDTLGVVLIGLGRYADAEPMFRRIVTVASERYGADHWLLPYARAHRGVCLVELRQYADAEPPLLAAYPHLAPLQDADTAQTLEYLVKLYADWGKPEQAVEWEEKLANLKVAQGG